jgi:glycosidase
MPDLNFDHPEVRAEMKRLARLELARGVDGFRLDPRLVETGAERGAQRRAGDHAFMKELSAAVRRERPGRPGRENWTSTAAIASTAGPRQVEGGDGAP